MIRGFYSAASGLIAQQTHLDIIANNMANSSTVGYKPQQANFATLLYENVNGALPAISTGHGAKVQQVSTNFEPGELQKTDFEMDFAIVGDGFFALEGAGDSDGDEENIFYTRAGNFQWQVDGDTRTLITPAGDYVLDSDGSRIELDDDQELELKMIGVFNMPNPYGMTLEGGNKYSLTEASGEAEAIEMPSVQQGYLENSKAEVAIQLVKMIEASKGFSLNAKVVTTADEIEQTVNSLR